MVAQGGACGGPEPARRAGGGAGGRYVVPGKTARRSLWATGQSLALALTSVLKSLPL